MCKGAYWGYFSKGQLCCKHNIYQTTILKKMIDKMKNLLEIQQVRS